MDRIIVTISPSTTGYQLSTLCTGEYTRVGQYWVWVEGNTVHISDSIGGTPGMHRVGDMDDRLANFRPANGRVTGRAALLEKGYRVSIENDTLYVRLNGSIVVERELDDTRYYQWYIIRGWRAVKLHSEGKGLESEDYWWREVPHIEVEPGKSVMDMTGEEREGLMRK